MTPQTSRCRTRRRAFAGVLAITLLILVGATLAAVASAFAADARRTRLAVADAQLRQLLTAGAATAAAELQSGDLPSGPKPLTLPSDLADADVSAAMTFERTDDQAVVHVVAKSSSHAMGQTLRFRQSAGRWSLQSAELD
jgi:hypothetical protein